MRSVLFKTFNRYEQVGRCCVLPTSRLKRAAQLTTVALYSWLIFWNDKTRYIKFSQNLIIHNVNCAEDSTVFGENNYLKGLFLNNRLFCRKTLKDGFSVWKLVKSFKTHEMHHPRACYVCSAGYCRMLAQFWYDHHSCIQENWFLLYSIIDLSFAVLLLYSCDFSNSHLCFSLVMVRFFSLFSVL